MTATALAVPEGFEITSVGGDGARLFVHVRDAAGTEWIRVHDAADGAFLSRIEVVRERLDDSSPGQ